MNLYGEVYFSGCAVGKHPWEFASPIVIIDKLYDGSPFSFRNILVEGSCSTGLEGPACQVRRPLEGLALEMPLGGDAERAHPFG